MSKVISFRLDEDNHRESRALAILETTRKKGYSIRHIITEALISLDTFESNEKTNNDLKEVIDRINQIQETLERQNFSHDSFSNKYSELSSQGLSSKFLTSVKQSVKTGVKLAEK